MGGLAVGGGETRRRSCCAAPRGNSQVVLELVAAARNFAEKQ